MTQQTARQRKWDARFMELARLVATWSKDRSTKVGAVIVAPDLSIRSVGFNGFPPGLDDDNDAFHERPLKYDLTSHAERNSLDFATTCVGCVLYSTVYPCADCARGMLRRGIARLVTTAAPLAKLEDGRQRDWIRSTKSAELMFQTAGVSVTLVGMP